MKKLPASNEAGSFFMGIDNPTAGIKSHFTGILPMLK